MQQALVNTLNLNLGTYFLCLPGELDFCENYFIGMFYESRKVYLCVTYPGPILLYAIQLSFPSCH